MRVSITFNKYIKQHNMKKKEITAIIGIGAAIVGSAIAYTVVKKKKQRIAAEDSTPRHKHSHIRKVKHAHEPDFTA